MRTTAFAMPLTNSAFPVGQPIHRPRIHPIPTDPEALRQRVPEPLVVIELVVSCEFIRKPDSTVSGDYNESGQVIGRDAGGSENHHDRQSG